MDNIFYDTVMVRSENWREEAAKLVAGTKATAAFHAQRKHGVLIRIGATSKDELKAIFDKTIGAAEA